MIGSIRGILSSKGDGYIIIETGGIGYIVNVANNSPLLLSPEGDEIKAYTRLIVREDDMSLYGFFDKISVTLFNKLISVSGIGARAAIAILSVLQPDELVKAIKFGDSAMLTRANGIGKKSAERVILELGDKLADFNVTGINIAGTADSGNEAFSNEPRAEAIDAMINLGYTKSQAASAVLDVEDEGLSTEDYIREALKKM